MAVLPDTGTTPPCQLEPTFQSPSAVAIHVKLGGLAPNIHLMLLPELMQFCPVTSISVPLIFSESFTSAYVMARVPVGFTFHRVPLEALTIDTGLDALPVSVHVPLMIWVLPAVNFSILPAVTHVKL